MAAAARSSPRERGSAGRGLAVTDVVAVLPARAGVSRGRNVRRSHSECPPRASGGQPDGVPKWEVQVVSSPRERGSADRHRPRHRGGKVLPARAGVSRWPTRSRSSRSGPPRASGGQPPLRLKIHDRPWSSPRERGSAGARTARAREGCVLPARAGVSRSASGTSSAPTGPPRASGGQPAARAAARVPVASSPRERGSAVPSPPSTRGGRVLPARAGVSRPTPRRTPTSSSPPRASGGQPQSPGPLRRILRSSPRERGSAGDNTTSAGHKEVLPARAGVSRLELHELGGQEGPPRASGGQPPGTAQQIAGGASSPRERGSAAALRHLPALQIVLPARAGVSRRLWRATPPTPGPPRASGGQPVGHK